MRGHVVIRCDASSQGGIGHLVRAISVAEAAHAGGHSVALAGSIDSPFARELVSAAGLQVVPAVADLGVLAAEQGAEVLHVDHYGIGTDAAQQVRRSGALFSSMEDGAFGRRPADLVVDPTIGAELAVRPDDGSAAVLRGVAYAPMRAEVRAARAERTVVYRQLSGDADVLVVMGGTDATGSAATLAGICRAAEGVGSITVITPAQNWDSVRSEAGEGIELLEPGPGFLTRAARADLVVSAAGTTSWELACIGVPSLLVAVVENQRAGYEAAISAGIAQGLGMLDEVRSDPVAAASRVSAAVDALRADDSWAPLGMSRVDGQGADRIVAAWAAALARRLGSDDARVVARRATIDDSLLLLRWRNDPVTRAMSRGSSTISVAAHRTWYQRALDDSARELLVVERGGVPIGTVRFDLRRPEEWEVSISVAPEARGRRLAKSVLQAAEAVFAESHPGVLVVATVLADNDASRRLFAGAGYALAPDRRVGVFDVFVRAG